MPNSSSTTGNSDVSVPEIPPQSHGLHFTINDGKITSVPSQDIGPDGNDYRRLSALHAPLKMACQRLIAKLSEGNMPFASLSDAADTYFGELDNNVEHINYPLLYAYGLLLASEYESTADLIEKGDLPDLNVDALSSVRGLLALHGPFILSSQDGNDLVTLAERYTRNLDEEHRFQKDLNALGEKIAERPDIFGEPVIEAIPAITKTGEILDKPERGKVFSKGSAKNLVIVTAGGAVAAAIGVGLMSGLGETAGGIASLSLGWLAKDGIKNSKPYVDINSSIQTSLGKLSDIEANDLREKSQIQFGKIRDFVVANFQLLRRVGGNAIEMKWFQDILKFIKPPEQSSAIEMPVSVEPQFDNEEEQDAYREAVKRIENANIEGSTELDLSDLKALTLIPLSIGKITKVNMINLANTQVADLSPLSNTTQMKKLFLNGTQVADLAPLSNMTRMETLYLSDTHVVDLAPLRNMAQMKWLSLDSTLVADLVPLTNMIQMERLVLSNTQVTDLSPLTNLTQIIWLNLNASLVFDLAQISNMTLMEHLYIQNTVVADLMPLSNMIQIKTLALFRTLVADLSPLSNMTQMNDLHLEGTQVADVAPLSNMTQMRTLGLHNTQVADLAPLSNMTQMKYLYLENTLVADVAPLSNMTKMETLYLNNTQVADVAPLKHLKKLEIHGFKK